MAFFTCTSLPLPLKKVASSINTKINTSSGTGSTSLTKHAQVTSTRAPGGDSTHAKVNAAECTETMCVSECQVSLTGLEAALVLSAIADTF